MLKLWFLFYVFILLLLLFIMMRLQILINIIQNCCQTEIVTYHYFILTKLFSSFILISYYNTVTWITNWYFHLSVQPQSQLQRINLLCKTYRANIWCLETLIQTRCFCFFCCVFFFLFLSLFNRLVRLKSRNSEQTYHMDRSRGTSLLM